VGRLGSEKRLDRLKVVLDRVPGTRLALVGSGPAEKQLKELFRGYPVVFTGALQGFYMILVNTCEEISIQLEDYEVLVNII